VCDLETSRMGAPYIYDISHLRVNIVIFPQKSFTLNCVRSAYVRNTNGNICLRMYLKIINQKRTIKYRKTTSWKYLRIHIYTPVATFKAERRHFGYK